jgi:hypothetical protein
MRLLDFSVYLILQAAVWLRIFSASIRNDYQKMFLDSKAPPARKADNLTDKLEPIA